MDFQSLNRPPTISKLTFDPNLKVQDEQVVNPSSSEGEDQLSGDEGEEQDSSRYLEVFMLCLP